MNQSFFSRYTRSVRHRLLALSVVGSLLGIVVSVTGGHFWMNRAVATSTRLFDIDDSAAFAEGEFLGTVSSSLGHVTAGTFWNRVALPSDSGVVMSSFVAADGAVYVGAGGKVYRVRGSQVDFLVDTGAMAVTSITQGGNQLFIGTMPEGTVFSVDLTRARDLSRGPVTAVRFASLGSPSTPAETATPPEAGQAAVVPTTEDSAAVIEPQVSNGAEAVWALAYHAATQRLFAATGPHAVVYAIDSRGTASVYWDGPGAHIMSLALLDDGSLYAGSSDDAVLTRITSAGQSETIYDFTGNEVTALDLRAGVLAIAVNEFPDAAPAAGGSGPTKSSATSGRSTRSRNGRGRLWVRSAAGSFERIWSTEESHIARVQVGDSGEVYAGLGGDGRIVRVDADRGFGIWADVDERQIAGFSVRGHSPFVLTNDGAGFYVGSDRGTDPRSWTSKVLDAEFRSRFGQLVFRGAGGLRVRTRSGNSLLPDASWSNWSEALTAPGPVRSPAARFVQVRVEWTNAAARLDEVGIYYLQDNQRPAVLEVGLKNRPTKANEVITPSTNVVLSWRIDNPDADRIRYRLRYRPEGQTAWRILTRDTEVITALEYTWNTEAVPDGRYEVEVAASDELSNPWDLRLENRLVSEPILVDNHAPILNRLRVEGGRVRGEAEDSLGPIARLEYAVNGVEWFVVFPDDDFFDTRTERFDFVPMGAVTGSVIAVRAYDTAGNGVVGEVIWP